MSWQPYFKRKKRGVVTYHYNPRIQRQEEDHKFQTSKYEASEMAQ